jgi:ParB family chromosome partitioning protein
MEAMKDSITHSGIINPPLVRPHPTKKGYYELVDGRNRRTAARELGYTTMACLVRKMDDDEAILQMINSNLQQRESLLPSEKAWAYREMLEAMNRQGKRTDLTSGQVVTKLGSRSDNELGENVGESGRQVQRYVRLTYLIPDLLKRVDEGRLGLTVGVTISYMSIQGQQLICKLFFELGNTPITRKVADQLRELDAEGRLDTLTVESTVLAHTEKVKKTKWVGSMKTVRDKYFDKKDSDDDIAATIDKALEAYFKKKNVK